MPLLLAVVLGVIALYLYRRSRGRGTSGSASDTTEPVDAWVAHALERELAERTLGIAGASEDERGGLRDSLTGRSVEPEIVAKIASLVRAVELEFTRYAHEPDVELVVRVRYEDGATAVSDRRLPWAELPEGVRAEFERTRAVHVFRPWAFPWDRARSA